MTSGAPITTGRALTVFAPHPLLHTVRCRLAGDVVVSVLVPRAHRAVSGFGCRTPHAALGGYIPAQSARECRASPAQPSDRLGVTPIVS